MAEQMDSVAEERLDFSQDVTVKTETKVWTISGAEIETNEAGTGTYLAVDFQDEDTPFPRTETFYLKHDDVPGKNMAQKVQIDRGNAKRLYKAALGTTEGFPSQLVGKKVVATISENEQGYAHLKNYKAAPAAEAIS